MYKIERGKRFFLLGAAFIVAYFFCPALLHGQTYRVYRPIPQDIATESTPTNSLFSRFSISGWSSISTGRMVDGADNVLSDYMVGLRLRLMYEIWENLYIGAEAAKMEAADKQSPFLSSIRQEEFAGVIQWVFTPHTQPKLYMTLSLGQIQNKTSFKSGLKDFHHQTAYLTMGVGGMYRISDLIKVGGEYRLKYIFSPWKTFIFEEEGYLRQELAVGISLTF